MTWEQFVNSEFYAPFEHDGWEYKITANYSVDQGSDGTPVVFDDLVVDKSSLTTDDEELALPIKTSAGAYASCLDSIIKDEDYTAATY